jgi:hypothetical protein
MACLGLYVWDMWKYGVENLAIYQMKKNNHSSSVICLTWKNVSKKREEKKKLKLLHM